jgi:hypothetical protein
MMVVRVTGRIDGRGNADKISVRNIGLTPVRQMAGLRHADAPHLLSQGDEQVSAKSNQRRAGTGEQHKTNTPPQRHLPRGYRPATNQPLWRQTSSPRSDLKLQQVPP